MDFLLNMFTNSNMFVKYLMVTSTLGFVKGIIYGRHDLYYPVEEAQNKLVAKTVNVLYNGIYTSIVFPLFPIIYPPAVVVYIFLTNVNWKYERSINHKKEEQILDTVNQISEDDIAQNEK